MNVAHSHADFICFNLRFTTVIIPLFGLIKKFLKYYSHFYFNTCTLHLFLFCTVTNKHTIIAQIITLLHLSTLSCHPQGTCNQYLATLQYFRCSCW